MTETKKPDHTIITGIETTSINTGDAKAEAIKLAAQGNLTDKVIVGRTKDDMIFVAMPPTVMACSFMILAGNHISIACDFVSAMAYHMKNSDVIKSGVASEPIINTILESVKMRHNLTDISEGAIKAGNSENDFDGMYFGEIHPIELAAVGYVMQEVLQAMPKEIDAPTVTNILKLWIESDARLIKPEERMALMGTEGKA